MSTGTSTGKAGDDVRRARAYLSRVAQGPSRPLTALVAELGPVAAAERVRQVAGLRDDVRAAVEARHGEDRAEADLDAVAARGGRLVVPEDAEWPALAFAAFSPPLVASLAPRRTPVASLAPDLLAPLALWVHGPLSLAEIGPRSVAVVGARAATDYGLWVARDWSAGLADRDVPVVSGAALGIDAAGHRGALAVEGPTVAVLATGTDRPYPPSHVRLISHIAERGAVLSEYPPGTGPAKGRFLVRNRLIAALAGGTVIVEAGVRSGALRTARVAARLGRPVMAAPGPVTSALSVGCHGLVREHGAVLVTGVDHIIELVGRMGDDLAPLPSVPARPTDGLGTDARAVQDALGVRAARSEHRLAQDSGVDPATITTHLSELADRGLAERLQGGWRARPG